MLDPLIKKYHYLIFFLIGYHLQQYNISKINNTFVSKGNRYIIITN